MFFNNEFIVYDISFYNNEEDEILFKYQHLLPYFRNGLSLIGSKSDVNKLQITRKGLFKLFEFNQNLLEVKNDIRSKKIQQNILKPCALALDTGRIIVKLKDLH